MLPCISFHCEDPSGYIVSGHLPFGGFQFVYFGTFDVSRHLEFGITSISGVSRQREPSLLLGFKCGVLRCPTAQEELTA